MEDSKGDYNLSIVNEDCPKFLPYLIALSALVNDETQKRCLEHGFDIICKLYFHLLKYSLNTS